MSKVDGQIKPIAIFIHYGLVFILYFIIGRFLLKRMSIIKSFKLATVIFGINFILVAGGLLIINLVSSIIENGVLLLFLYNIFNYAIFYGYSTLVDSMIFIEKIIYVFMAFIPTILILLGRLSYGVNKK
jgi:hypothetical protein